MVQAGEHQRLRGKSMRAPRRCGRDAAPVIVHVVAARQAPHPFVEEALLSGRDHVCVGDNVVDRVEAKRAGKAHEVNLHRRRPRCEDAETPAQRVSVAINENVDVIFANHARDFGVTHVAHVAPAVERRTYALADCSSGVKPVAVGRDLEPVPIVTLEKTRHLARGRMIAEVAGEVADTQTLGARRRFSTRRDLRQHRLRPAPPDRELLRR